MSFSAASNRFNMKFHICFILSCLCVYLTKAEENDCQPSTLDKLNLYELLEKSKLSEECLYEARRTFATNYDKSQFILTGPFIVQSPEAIREMALKKFVIIRSLDVIRDVLANFGGLIDNMELSFEKMGEADAKQVVQYVNELHESLEMLNLKSCKRDVLIEFTNTFKNVFNLTYSSSSSEVLQTNTRYLNDIFPNVINLSVGFTKAEDWVIIDETFDHLKDFTVELPLSEADNSDEMQIHCFLRKNWQITKLVVKNASLRLLSGIEEILPYLNTLNILGFSKTLSHKQTAYEAEPFELNIVKWLLIDAQDENEILTMITFNHLDTLTLIVPRFTENWMKFLQKRVNPVLPLKKIFIYIEDLPKEHFLFISNTYQNVHEVMIDAESKFVADDVIGFLKNCEEINSMTLIVEMVQSEQKNLENILSKDWGLEFIQRGIHIEIRLNRDRKCSSVIPNLQNLHELLTKLQIRPECQVGVQEEFKNIYLQTDFIFRGPFIDEEKQAIEVCKETDTIYVRNLKAVKQLLDAFGSQIYSITVDFQVIESDDSVAIVNYINDKCSETLEVLNLLNCKGKAVNGLKNEFTYVSKVKFSSSQFDKLEFDSDEFKMQEMFPALVNLEIEHTKPTDWTFIAGKLPKLRILSVQLPQVIGKDTINGSHISSLFMSNKKIRDLTIMHPTFKLLNVVNEKLSKLENLELIKLSDSYLNVQTNSIEFHPLEHLLLRPQHENDILKGVVFNTLDHLSFVSKHNFNSKWMQFIAEQIDTNLNGFNLKVGGIERENLEDIPKILPALVDVEIECQCNFMASNILGFIERSERLKSFRLKIQINESEVTHLFEQLKEKWNIKRNDHTDTNQMLSIYLQRKNESGTLNATNGGGAVNSTNEDDNGARFLNANPFMQVLAFVWILIFVK